MASPRTDQAEGLRRLRSSPLPGLCTVLSADSDGDKRALMQRLAASMRRRGHEVLLVDAAAAAPAQLLQQIAVGHARVLVDAQLDEQGRLPLPQLSDGELVVQLSGSPDSIRSAYQILRLLKEQCGCDSVALLVTDADPLQARRAHANLFHAASRYLGLSVRSIVPQETSHV